MKKSIYIILLCFLLLPNTKVFAQADCFFKYSYVGKIAVKNNDTGNIYLQLPSAEFIKKIVRENKGFINSKVSSGNFKKDLVTIGSSFFCGTPENIIERIFKGKKGKYIIYVVRNEKRYKRTIDTKNINFKTENGIIYIELPVITI